MNDDRFGNDEYDFNNERDENRYYYNTGESEYYNGNYGDPSPTMDDIRKVVREEVKRVPKKKTPWLRIIIITLLFSVLSSMGTAVKVKEIVEAEYGRTSQSGEATKTTINVKGDENVENAIAKKAIPSVVGITTITQSNDIFNMNKYVEGVGSGVIVSSDGYILTNSHVVGNGRAKEMTVVFSDGEKTPGKLIWQDESLDLAVIKVEKTGLPVMDIGDSDKVSVGDKAVAIGNPLGLDLQSTLTSGYISGLNRTINMENGSSMDGLIQTDAAINGGNSGGALLNAKGQLIGINTAKASGGEGIGFAIPINIAKSIVNEIKEKGNFESVKLGIQGVDLKIYEKYFQVNTGAENGAVIIKVEPASPAGKAGLQANDIILKIGDKDISGMNDIRKALLDYRIGDEVELEILRNGNKEKVKLKFEEFMQTEN
ncbi:S1C family serine protease [Mediannikoviicoccus vaginalis]|uniref:S1C family serine protease n=1 Tax=Mediannikoviicoccus vaginalis TaxID=2899727 RepID=UPI001F2E20EC|nr:trypsin-like peptidase domain-containing protein [Mediannikoviicoccus vaginalis]